MMWIYKSFKELRDSGLPPGKVFWEVGFFEYDDRWCSDGNRYETRFEAAARVNYLNGGTGKAPATLVGKE